MSNLQKTIECERKAVCFCVRVIRQWGLSADSFFSPFGKNQPVWVICHVGKPLEITVTNLSK